MTFSAVTGIGYGDTNTFYYLRYDTNGNTVFGTIDALPSFPGTPAARAVDQFTLTGHYQELEFTPTDVGYGATLFYSITGSYTTSNTVTTYTTNSVVSFTPTNTVTAFGSSISSICQPNGQQVTAVADCSGTIVPIVVVVGTTNGPNGGLLFTLSFPTQSGKSYIVQYKDTLLDPTWTDLIPPGSATGTGGIMIITDPSPAALHPSRFYRIKFM
jgi:hypothetical protein